MYKMAYMCVPIFRSVLHRMSIKTHSQLKTLKQLISNSSQVCNLQLELCIGELCAEDLPIWPAKLRQDNTSSSSILPQWLNTSVTTFPNSVLATYSVTHTMHYWCQCPNSINPLTPCARVCCWLARQGDYLLMGKFINDWYILLIILSVMLYNLIF